MKMQRPRIIQDRALNNWNHHTSKVSQGWITIRFVSYFEIIPLNPFDITAVYLYLQYHHSVESLSNF